MTPELEQALHRFLLTVADDELVLGYRGSEWTGVAPMVEEDLAFSSLAQDEIGHARLYYTLAAELTGGDADHLALSRPKSDYYHARLVEQRTAPKYDPSGEHPSGGNWARAIAGRFLYERFDDLRTEALAGSGYVPLRGAVQKIRREERYHLLHAGTWWERLAAGSGESRERLEVAVAALWPDVLGLFEESPGEPLLVAEGILPRTTSQLRPLWLERVVPDFELHGLSLPSAHIAPAPGGRQGVRGSDWDELHEEMTMVRRLEPEGVW